MEQYKTIVFKLANYTTLTTSYSFNAQLAVHVNNKPEKYIELIKFKLNISSN